MNFLLKENPDRWHQLAWWLCVITLPWLDMAFNVSLILLGILSLTAPELKERLLRVKSTKWIWPFFIYYILLMIGTLYTPDVESGLFTLDRKITFVVLPLIAIIGRGLNEEFLSFLKRSFVYSCCILILLCLTLATINFLSGADAYNFDISGAGNYNALHPNASTAWMHFSYIQLAKQVNMHPGYFSMYLVFCIVILFTEKYTSRKEELVHTLLSLGISCFTALLSSRMAIIAFTISTAYLIIHKMRQPIASLAIFVVVASIGFLMFFNPVARYRIIEEPLKTKYVANTSVTEWNSVSYRLLEWQGSWSVIRDHIFFGVGTSGWKIALNDFYANYNSSVSGTVFNSHNQFLQVWLENGILTLFIFLFCVFGFIFRPQVDQTYVAFILIFSLMCMTESILEWQKGIVFFTMFQTLFLAFENKLK